MPSIPQLARGPLDGPVVAAPIAKSILMYCFGVPNYRINRSVLSVEVLFEFLISKFGLALLRSFEWFSHLGR